jgi:putative transposase
MDYVHLMLILYLKIFHFTFAGRETSSKYLLYIILYFRPIYKKDITRFVSIRKEKTISIWNGIQHYTRKMFGRKRRIYEFIVDETLIKVGDEFV